MLESGNIRTEKFQSLLEKKIKQDDFLNEYQLKGSLFTKNFIEEHNQLYQKAAERYEFGEGLNFKDTVEKTNDFIHKSTKHL